jgi:hypothetical protein
MAARPYKRLPGRSNGFLNSATLWEADDHLLLVESHRVSESYRRFFYRDIQAVVICRTESGLMMSLVLGLLAAVLGASGYMVGDVAGVTMGVFAGVFLLFALLNLLGGPTCRCTLRTAVQTQHLPSLNRLRKARKALARLQPKIAAFQENPPQ